MKTSIFILLFLICGTYVSAQNVGINSDGSSSDASAMLDINSTNGGLLIPRIALTGTADVATIPSPTTTLLIYNTATVVGVNGVTPGFYYWNGSAWIPFISTVLPGWLIIGNPGTTVGTNFLGTTDNQPLDIRTYKVIRARFTTKGQLEFLNNGSSVFVGESAGAADDFSANENVFIGFGSGNTNTSGELNTAVGSLSFYDNVSGSRNTAFGYSALKGTTSSYNTAVGYNALSASNSGEYAVAIGSQALEYNTTGTQNIAIGALSLRENTTGAYNTATGFKALGENSQGNFNTATGMQASFHNSTGSNNTSTGRESLICNTTGNNNTSFGTNTLAGIGIDGYDNTALGHGALYGSAGVWAVNIGYGNTATGFASGNQITTGIYNSATGWSALNKTSTGSYNSALGMEALLNNTTGNNNIGIGRGAVVNNETGSENIGIGTYTLPVNVNFSNNIAIGNTASGVTQGINNIVIGDHAYSPDNFANYQLSIGNIIYGTAIDGAGATLSAGNIGIGLIAPAAKLDIEGDVKLGVNGTVFTNLIKETVSIDLPNIASGGGLTQTVSVGNAEVGSSVMISPEAGPVGITIASAWVSGAGIVSVQFRNNTAAAIDLPARNYNITVIK